MKKLTALFLTLVMLLPLSTAVFAAPVETLNYVSLGDSTTMGYFVGEGYDDDYSLRHYDDLGNAHLSEYSVSTLFSEYLTEQGYEVNTRDLTTRGMRPKELHAILDRDYFDSLNPEITVFAETGRVGLQRSTWYLLHLDTYMFYEHTYCYQLFGPDQHPSADELRRILDETYTAINDEYIGFIRDADVITYDLLNGDGLYFADRISGLLGGNDNYATYYGRDTFESVMRQAACETVVDAAETLQTKLTDSLNSVGLSGNMITGIMDAMLYSFANALVNFSDTVDLIYQENPDVNLIVVSPYNPLAGLTATYQGITINLEKLWGYVVEAVSAYLIKSDPHAGQYALADCSGGVENCIVDFGQGSISSKAYANFRNKIASRLYDWTGRILDPNNSDFIRNITQACQNTDVSLDIALSGLNNIAAFDSLTKSEALTSEDQSNILLYMILDNSRGIGIHPSADGYRQKTDAIIKAYESSSPAQTTYLVRAVKLIQYLLCNTFRTMSGDAAGRDNLNTLFTRLFAPVIDCRELIERLLKQ